MEEALQPLVARSPNGQTVAILPRPAGSGSASNRSLRLLLWSVESKSLQSTFVHRPPATNDDADDDDGVAAETTQPPQKIVFIQNEFVAVLLEKSVLLWDLTRGVVVNELVPSSSSDKKKKKTGRESDASEEKGTKAYVLDDIYATDETLYMLIRWLDNNKIQVNQYGSRSKKKRDAVFGKLQRKIKVGKDGDGPARLTVVGAEGPVSEDDTEVVRTLVVVRRVDRRAASLVKFVHSVSGNELGRTEVEYPGGSSNSSSGGDASPGAAPSIASLTGGGAATQSSVVCAVLAVPTSPTALVLDAATRARLATVPVSWSASATALKAGEDESFSSPDLHVWKAPGDTTGSTVYLTAGDALYRLEANDSAPAASLGTATLQSTGHWNLVAHGGIDRRYCLGVVQNATTGGDKATTSSSESAAALLTLLVRDGQYKLAAFAIPERSSKTSSGAAVDIPLAWEEPKATTKSTKPKEKENVGLSQGATTVGLAPTGEARVRDGVERPDAEEAENMDVDDEGDENEMTVAERLALITQTIDKEQDEMEAARDNRYDKFNPKTATTESLSRLLSQALQSGDRAMLETALNVRDQRIIKETCAELNDHQLTELFHAVTARLHQTEARGQQMVNWILCIFRTGRMRNTGQWRRLLSIIDQRVQRYRSYLHLRGQTLLWELEKERKQHSGRFS